MPIGCLLFACWITKATNTQSEYILLPPLTHTATVVAPAQLNFTLYVHCLSCHHLKSSHKNLLKKDNFPVHHLAYSPQDSVNSRATRDITKHQRIS